MGCPDWPKCFGLLVPPTSVSEIPQTFFETHPGFETKTFNVYQTWTEYLNRLVGAMIGLLMLATFVLSLVFWSRDKRIVVLSFLAMVLTGVEAWLGKVVVDKNLEGGTVTLHMLLAILIMGILITAVYLGLNKRSLGNSLATLPSYLRWLGLGLIVMTVVQILFGTQIREQVDAVASKMGGFNREMWLEALDWKYLLHRVLWIVVTGMAVVWAKGILAHAGKNVVVRRLTLLMVTGFASEVLLGILLSGMDLPPVLQPLHLLFANIVFAVEFALLLQVFGVEKLFAVKSQLNAHLPSGNLIDAKH